MVLVSFHPQDDIQNQAPSLRFHKLANRIKISTEWKNTKNQHNEFKGQMDDKQTEAQQERKKKNKSQIPRECISWKKTPTEP